MTNKFTKKLRVAFATVAILSGGASLLSGIYDHAALSGDEYQDARACRQEKAEGKPCTQSAQQSLDIENNARIKAIGGAALIIAGALL